MSDDDKVKPIGVRFKERPAEGDPMLRIVEARYGSGACDHRHYFDGNPLLGGARLREVQYLIREGETEVECGQCGTRLDPDQVPALRQDDKDQPEMTTIPRPPAGWNRL